MNDVREIELTIESARESIKMLECLARLGNNPDFNTLISEGYFEQEAIRLVKAKGKANASHGQSAYGITPERIEKEIDGIGCLMAYFNKIVQQGTQASDAMESHEQTQVDILAEDA